MSLTDKYSRLTQLAQNLGVENFKATEQDGVLYVSGTTTTSKKDQIWEVYDEIDPDMRAGDLVLDIQTVDGEEEIYEIKSGDSLSKIAQKYPGMTWQKIYEANKDVIKDPNVIFPGKKIKIPL